uniref:Bestrophin homolog n=1 Tax=Saccoglossus kowalevskii TaxID=10224 RepID=A0ABM0N054_SACKO|nr:PREDICTED: bestrophin-1-like [Saccoglossus kowalevskii]
MTVSYSLSTSRAGVLTFPRLLFRWRGSIYKLVYVELFIYLMFYFALSFTYRFALNAYQRTLFEEVCGFFSDIFLDVIPLSFLMGFYVALVAARWWNMYSAIPYIDGISQIFATYIRGNDDVTRMQRRSLVRWITLTSTIVFTSVSPPVLKRFPTCLHLVKAGEFRSRVTSYHLCYISAMRYCYLVFKGRPAQYMYPLLFRLKSE